MKVIAGARDDGDADTGEASGTSTPHHEADQQRPQDDRISERRRSPRSRLRQGDDEPRNASQQRCRWREQQPYSAGTGSRPGFETANNRLASVMARWGPAMTSEWHWTAHAARQQVPRHGK